MSTLSLSELKRRTPLFANKADEEEALDYSMARTHEEKLAESTRLTLDHDRELGVDVHKPMDKTLVRRIAPWAKTAGD